MPTEYTDSDQNLMGQIYRHFLTQTPLFSVKNKCSLGSEMLSWLTVWTEKERDK